jgi:hypothetical protein
MPPIKINQKKPHAQKTAVLLEDIRDDEAAVDVGDDAGDADSVDNGMVDDT